MSVRPDTQRLVGDILRFGTIASVDLAKRRCTVRVGDLVTGPIPWIAGRAGDTTHWSPPTAGEQVLLLCPEGDTAAGVALPGVYSDANPAPSSAEKIDLHRYADGAIVAYDAAGHHYSITLPAGATVTVSAPGGITFTGPVTIVGDVDLQGALTASDDVTASGTSLHGHKHGLVKAGTDQSGGPV